MSASKELSLKGLKEKKKKKYIKIIKKQEKKKVKILYDCDLFTTEGSFSLVLPLSVLRYLYPFQPCIAQGICHTGL